MSRSTEPTAEHPAAEWETALMMALFTALVLLLTLLAARPAR